MNLYIIGWNLPKERYPMVLTELRQMTDIYPHLDPETLWHHNTPCGTIFAASIHTADQAAAPRNYVMQSDDEVVFYSGLPVNPTGAYPAHRAKALSAHWHQLTENLEGMYFVTRATDDPPRLELLTDILGYEQVYYLQQGDLWLVSNSVWLIERISKPRALDPLGVSLFLSEGYVCDDRTLRSDIRVISGGQHWTWQKGDVEPRRQSYYPPSRLARQPHQALTLSRIEQLADDLMQPLRSLSQSFDNITCSLTGGRDSRLVTALLIGAGLKAQYHTFGDPSGTDAKIATLIAQTLDLPYEVTSITTPDVIRDWDRACWQSVRQTDGMRSLQLIAGVLKDSSPQIDHLDVVLWGAGGEVARCSSRTPYSFLSRPDVTSIQRFMVRKRIRDFGGLIRQEGIALVRDYIHRFVMKCADDGFAPVDIPDVYEMYLGDGRRVGSTSRGLMSIRDVFSPYCTRAFVEASFATPVLQRCTESLHYELMRLLSPELHRLPFGKKSWPPQQPIVSWLKSYVTSELMGPLESSYVASELRRVRRRILDSSKTKHDQVGPAPTVRSKMFDRLEWFEAKREQIREICLDQSDSLLWDFVDRSTFDRITSPATDPAELSQCLRGLYRIVALFYYEADDLRQAPQSER